MNWISKIEKNERIILLLMLLVPILIYKYNNIDFDRKDIKFIQRVILTTPEKIGSSKNGYKIELKVKADEMRYWIEKSSYCATKDKEFILNLPKDSLIEIGIRGKLFFDANLVNYPQGRDQILELSYNGNKLIDLDDVNRCIKKDFRFLFYGWIIAFLYNAYKIYIRRKTNTVANS